eukprot:GHVU01010435.1.p1 GENE.GHVU01010435.1~~GHVU01010435.1.p1  ORF type:complete len:257 (+),score=11.19 GHVU01010435.1:281-1051(+)
MSELNPHLISSGSEVSESEAVEEEAEGETEEERRLEKDNRWVRDVFEREGTVGDNYVYRCRGCNRTVQASRGSSSNLTKHCRRKTNGQCTALYEDAMEKLRLLEVSRTPAISDFTSSLATVRPLPAATSERLNDLIDMLVVGAELPISIVENHHFRELVSFTCPRYKHRSRQSRTRGLLTRLKAIEVAVQTELDGVKYVTIEVDGWSSARKLSMLCILAHINGKVVVRDVCTCSNTHYSNCIASTKSTVTCITLSP